MPNTSLAAILFGPRDVRLSKPSCRLSQREWYVLSSRREEFADRTFTIFSMHEVGMQSLLIPSFRGMK